MIFFDMDGVLVDFMGHINKEFPTIFSDMKNNTDFWNIIYDSGKGNFWIDLNPLEVGINLFKTVVAKYGYDNVRILSAYPSYYDNKYPIVDDALTGKYEWIRRYLGNECKAHIVKRRDKILYAGNGNILIDDYYKNVEEWNTTTGRAFLYTQEDAELVLAFIEMVK